MYMFHILIYAQGGTHGLLKMNPPGEVQKLEAMIQNGLVFGIILEHSQQIGT